MSLADTVRQGVEQAFAAASDFVSLGTYTRRGENPVYDPISDVMTYPTQVLTNVRIIRTSANNEEMEASPVTVSDVKFLVPAVDLGDIIPTEADYIQVDGRGYNPVSFKTVPGNSLWIIFAREK